MWIFFKDLPIIASAAIFQSGVDQLVFSGMLALAYTFIVALVLPYAERSANNADVLTALMLAMLTLLTAGFQDEDDTESHSTGIFAIFCWGCSDCTGADPAHGARRYRAGEGAAAAV